MDADKTNCLTCKEANPPHLLRDGQCPGCILDGFIPPKYQEREEYVMDPVWRHENATQKPKTGVVILDAPSALRAVDLLEVGKRAC